jgi:RalA-binding protein 1
LGTGAESRTLTPDWLPTPRTPLTAVSHPSLDSLDIPAIPAVPGPPSHQHLSTKPLHIPKVDNRTGAESGPSTFQASHPPSPVVSYPPNGTYLSGSSAPSPLETSGQGPQSLTQPQTASRESRITHSEEAKQHRSSPIHFLADSPRAAGLSQGHIRGLSPGPSDARNVPDVRDPTSDKPSTRRDLSDGEFLDLDDSDSLYDSAADHGLTSPSPQNPDDVGPRVAVLPPAADDFPLPPGIVNPSNLSNGESHLGTPPVTPAIEKARRIDGPESPTTPTPNAFGSHSPMSTYQFRALPLLPYDLPYTRITVTNSSIRPNDRGKDVLSFVVQVNPGNQKEPYMIEKLYSDVLGLDQRIRSRFGKSYKKIPHLPDGKLWKDHAPSRVDQRKVDLSSFPYARKLTPTI